MVNKNLRARNELGTTVTISLAWPEGAYTESDKAPARKIGSGHARLGYHIELYGRAPQFHIHKGSILSMVK